MAPTEHLAASERLGDLAGDVEAAVADLGGRDAVRRTWAGDHTLWQDDPTEVADRLGWIHSPAEMAAAAPALRERVAALAEGCTHALVMGMGGSSLFPEVLARSAGPADGGLHLSVLDSTDPAAVRRVEGDLPLDRTLFLAASKSGTTIETTSHLRWFRERVDDPRRFAVVTDPGSALGEQARSEGFGEVFENRPDIGGRYSALSLFGLVPAAAMGLDVRGLLASAEAMLSACGPGAPPEANPGLRLGAAMAAAARAGRDKLTVVLPDEVATFGLWLEQLVAESTGKSGTGVVPVVGEPPGPPEAYGADRLFVAYGEHSRLEPLAAAGHPVVVLPWAGDPYGLGGEVVRWEVATAMAGALLGINPFDQPDVAAAKEATALVLERGVPGVSLDPLDRLLGQLRPGDYLALQAYLDPEAPVVADLAAARVALRDRHRVATTLGVGPRFLHSTGQLHKGGPPTVVCVQVVGDDAEELPIPGRPYGFATLKQAQAAGDLETLRARGVRAGRVALDELAGVAR